MKNLIKVLLVLSLVYIFIGRQSVWSIFLDNGILAVTKNISNHESYGDWNSDSYIKGILLVNNEHKLSKDFEADDLRNVNIPYVDEASDEERKLNKKAAEAVEEMFEKARKDGIIFLGTSGYRSNKTQENIYKREVINNGKKYADLYVAYPGTSEHETGLAIDVTNEERYFVGSVKEAEWLAENSYRFGLIVRYPKGKEEITKKSYEPWHVRYVGEEAAEYIYNNQITLEEYLECE